MDKGKKSTKRFLINNYRGTLSDDFLYDVSKWQIYDYTCYDDDFIEGKTDEYSYILNNCYGKYIYAIIYNVKNNKINNLILDKKVNAIFFKGENLEYIPKLPDTIEYIQISLKKTPIFTHRLSKKLEILILDNTNIKEKLPDLSYLKKLWYIDASYNKIEKILSGTLPESLLYIDLAYNRLKTIPNSFPKKVVVLSFIGNKIKYLNDMSYLKKLDALYLGYNNISKVSKTPPVKGSYVSLAENPIDTNKLSNEWEKHLIRN